MILDHIQDRFDFTDILGFLKKMGGHDHLICIIHQGLAVIALIEGLGAAHLHNPRIEIGGVPLGLVRKSRNRALNFSRFFPILILVLLLFPGLFRGFVSKRLHRFLNLLKAGLPSLEFFEKVPALLSLAVSLIFLFIYRFGLLEKRRNLFFKFFLASLHPPITHVPVLEGVGPKPWCHREPAVRALPRPLSDRA
jgi:hypothetical protein